MRLIYYSIIIFFTTTIYAQDIKTNQPVEKKDVFVNEAQYQSVVEEFKKYLIQVKKDVKKEIIQFRKDILEINKQKKALYKNLSQEAQAYLAKEQEFKNKLPLKYKRNINIHQDTKKIDSSINSK